MRYEIVLAPQAHEDLNEFTARERANVRAGMETHLRFEPAKESKSRIKRLREMKHPQYRLRVDDIRVFYDIVADVVEIIAIVEKSSASAWLEKMGEKE